MYYFRDCYFDQQVAFGVARASIATTPHRRPRRARRARKDLQGSALDLIMPFVCIGATFGFGYLLLDVLGYESLVQAPPLDAFLPYIEALRTVAADLISRIPALPAGM